MPSCVALSKHSPTQGDPGSRGATEGLLPRVGECCEGATRRGLIPCDVPMHTTISDSRGQGQEKNVTMCDTRCSDASVIRMRGTAEHNLLDRMSLLVAGSRACKGR